MNGVEEMEIIDRRENDLLNRIEISFRWRHEGRSTPSRNDLLEMVRSFEPGVKKENIIVKEVNTRFGQPLTTGVAHIYGSGESMKAEPRFMLEKHGIEVPKKKGGAAAKPAKPVVADDGGEE